MGGRQGLLEDAKKKAKLSMSLNLGDLPVRKEKYFSYKGKKEKKKNAFKLHSLCISLLFSETKGSPRHWNQIGKQKEWWNIRKNMFDEMNYMHVNRKKKKKVTLSNCEHNHIPKGEMFPNIWLVIKSTHSRRRAQI